MFCTRKVIQYHTLLLGLFLSITVLFITCVSDVEVRFKPRKSPKLTFTKLTTDKENISKDELLQQIPEKEKKGFTIKNIILDDASFAQFDKAHLSLTLKKAGTFNFVIILGRNGFEDITLKASIKYLKKEPLTFDRITTAKKNLTKEDILTNIKGNKNGFTIKSITIDDAYKPFAQVKGTTPNFSITLKKAGDFSATIILQKTNYSEVTLKASFSGVPQKLTFKKLITYKKTINKDELLAQIPEKEKTGYTLKSIVLKNDTFAQVKGTAPDMALALKKNLGTFTADITLSKTGFLDVTIQNAVFNHISEDLALPKFETYSKILTKKHILDKIQGNKTGYTITKISVADARYADVNPTTYSLTLKKKGTFTIRVSLQKAGHPQETIAGQIQYKTFTFDKLTTAKNTVNKDEILKHVKGKKDGVTLKNIVLDDPSFADVNRTSLSLKIKKEGTFTATLTLDHPDYSYVTLRATFVFDKKYIFIFDKATQTITGIKDQYKPYFRTMQTVTFPDTIEGLEVQHIKGFIAPVPQDDRNVFGDYSNNHIQNIHLPKNLKTIAEGAFNHCHRLTSITIPDSVTSIGKRAFSGCFKLSSIVIGKSVASIGDSAFFSCDITSITIPNSVTTIKDLAFTSCKSLTSITIPNSVITIGESAFAGCSKLAYVDIADSVTSIGEKAFGYCDTQLVAIIRQTDPAKIKVESNTFGIGTHEVKKVLKEIRVPAGSLKAYQKATAWREWADKMVAY